jgi:hypothetical protein
MKVRDRAKSFHRFSLRGFRRIRFVLDTEGDMSDNLRVSTIIQPSDGKPNRYHNFDAIRLWSATAVIFSHSFIIAEGSEKRELIQAVTGEIAGMYGVYVFFVLSGFLITRSKLTSTSTISYLWKRFLRVYPAYFGSITIVVLLAAPFFSSEAIANYYLRKSVWDGILNGLVFNTEDYYVYGVSFYRSDSNLGNTLNSVLWTIQTEVLLYVCIAILHALRLLRMEMMALIAILAILAHLSKSYLFTNLWDYAYLNWWGLTVGARLFHRGFPLFPYSKPSSEAQHCARTCRGQPDPALPQPVVIPTLVRQLQPAVCVPFGLSNPLARLQRCAETRRMDPVRRPALRALCLRLAGAAGAEGTAR